MSWVRALQWLGASVVVLGLVTPAAAAPRQRKATMGKKSQSLEDGASSDAGSSGRRGPAKHRKSDLRIAPPLCIVTATAVDRGLGREVREIELVDCDGKASSSGRRALSIMARLRGSEIPTIERGRLVAASGAKPRPGEVSRGVKLVDPGLLVRLHTISQHFGGKPLSVVSGYRPQSQGSLHQHAKALDIRVRGVTNKEVVAFCRTLPDTGCGYYPNSTFVHVDVRKKGTGSVSWIDASGPGEPARYVKQWPPPEEESPKPPSKSAVKKADAPEPPNPPTQRKQATPGPAKHKKPQPPTKARAG